MPVGGIWVDLPQLNELMPWATTGMTSNRSWVIAPHPDVLKSRWEALAEAPPHQVNPLLSPTRDRSADRVVGPLPGYAQRGPLIRDRTPMESPAPLAWRAFDRQWVIPDQRVLDMPRPPLWRVLGRDQVFVMEHHSEPLRRGPGLLFTALLPASSYVKGSGGGRVLPLFADADGTQANLHPRLLPAWSTEVGVALTPFDWIRYLAGVTGYATFQQRFAEDLLVPGVRLPISTDLALVQRAQTLGDIALWAHTLGARGTLDRVRRLRTGCRAARGGGKARRHPPDVHALQRGHARAHDRHRSVCACPPGSLQLHHVRHERPEEVVRLPKGQAQGTVLRGPDGYRPDALVRRMDRRAGSDPAVVDVPGCG